MKFRLPLALCFSLSLCACGSLPPLQSTNEDPRITSIAGAGGETIPYKLVVGPLLMGFNQREFNQANAEKFRYSNDLDLNSLRGDVASQLLASQTFSEVFIAEGMPHGATTQDYLSLAWERGIDLVMEMKLTRYENSYEGTAASYSLNLVNWFMFMVPSWYVRDEIYGATVEVETSIYSAHTGKVVYSKSYSGTKALELDDFERGWELLGILSVPSSLDPENWQAVCEVAMPYAIHEVEVGMISDLKTSFRKTAFGEDFARTMAKSLVLAIGVARYEDQRIPRARFAEEDALSVVTALNVEESQGPEAQVRERYAHVLLSQQATRRNIIDVLNGFIVKRSTKFDHVVIFWAGHGASVTPATKGETTPALVPYDARVDAAERTTLSIDEMLDILSHAEAEKVFIIIDTAFASTPEGRSVLSLISQEAADSLKTWRPGLPPNCTLVVSSSPGENALESVDLKHGLFTYHLVQGLEGKADLNRDGRVEISEAIGYAAKHVESQSSLEGRPQHPLKFAE